MGFRRSLLAGSAGLAALLASQAAWAQTAADDATDVETVVVTASRVERSGFVAPTPTTVVGAQQLRDADITSIGQLTKEIPAFAEFNSPTAVTQSITAVGSTTFNLRGLGSTRTLTLIDGRRHVPTTAAAGVDVNVIPAILVERVEVVTGGASADWGSDAVTGVVNIILKKSIDGFEGTVRAGQTGHGDNRNWQAGLGWGTSFGDGRGRFMIGGEYYKNEGILSAADRDWSSRQYGLITNPAYAPGNGQHRLVLAPNFQSSSATLGGLILTGVARGTDFGPNGTPVAFTTGQYFNPASFNASPTGAVAAGQSMSGGSGFNPGIFIPLSLPMERTSLYSRASFDFTDDITGYVEGSWVKSHGESPTTFGADNGMIFGSPLTISVNNAFLPQAIRTQMQNAGQTSFLLGRYNTDFGFLFADDTFETARFVAGLDGRLSDKWKWSAYYQYGHTEEFAQVFNNVLTARLAAATNSTLVGGVATCTAPVGDSAPCVPINLFGSGSPGGPALAYIHGTAWRSTNIEQHVAAAEIKGDLFSTWAGPVSVVAGADFRRDELEQVSDPTSIAGGFLLNLTRTNLSGAVEVKEAFGEAVVPLLADAPLARSLEFNGAVRFSAYNVRGPASAFPGGIVDRDFDTTTWKAGLTWQVVDDLRLRAVRSRDIRAANVNELFTAMVQGATNIVWNSTNTPITTFRGGNPLLNPEEADTTTFGVIWRPSWLEGFSASVDWYDITINGAIASAAGTAQQIANACAAGDAVACSAFTFGAGGVPTQLRTANVNINQLKAKGIDFEVGYVTPLSRFNEGWDGRLSLRLLANYMEELSKRSLVGGTAAYINRAGETGNNNDLQGPEWQVIGSAAYDLGRLRVYASGRWIKGGKYDVTYNRNGALDLANNDMPDRFTLNASVQWALVREDGRELTIFGAVNNLFDQDPPIMPQNFQVPQQVGGLYDVIGRTFSMGVRFNY